MLRHLLRILVALAAIFPAAVEAFAEDRPEDPRIQEEV